MKRKTLTFAGKRYKKSKPSDLFTAMVFEQTWVYDEDGDLLSDDNRVVTVKRHACSLIDILNLIENDGCTDGHEVYGCEAWFNSETDRDTDGNETRTEILITANREGLMDRLEAAYCHANHRSSNRLRRRQTQRASQEAARRRAQFTCLSGDAWLARRSTADLRRVV